MKRKKKIKLVGLIVTLGLMCVLNLSLNDSNYGNKKSCLEFLSLNAHAADSESDCGPQASTLGSPKTGKLCYCNGQIVARQTCEGFTGNCSPITCDE